MSPIVTVIIAVVCLSAGCAGGFAFFRYILTGKYKDTMDKAEKAAEVIKEKKLLEVTDGDMETAQKRVAKLIRDVNKCITLLSEK